MDPIPALKSIVKKQADAVFGFMGFSQYKGQNKPTQTFQVPVASLTIEEALAKSPEVQIGINFSVDSACNQVAQLLKTYSTPIHTVKTSVAVERKNYMYHIYMTVEAYS